MANADAPFGFRPINLDGSSWSGGTVRAVIPDSDSTATFVGDAVKLLGAGSGEAYPAVIQCAAGDPVFGVIVAFEADPTALEDQYRKASTKRYCQVVLADKCFFEVQSDDDTTALAVADVGLNANFIVGSGSTVTGLSGMELNSDGAATTSTLDLQIMALVDRADNDISNTGTNKNVIVKFNDPQTKPLRTGV